MDKKRYELVVKGLEDLEKLKTLADSIFHDDMRSVVLWDRGLKRIEYHLLAAQLAKKPIVYNKYEMIDELTKLIKFYNDSKVRTDSIYYAIKDYLVDMRYELQVNGRVGSWFIKNYKIRQSMIVERWSYQI